MISANELRACKTAINELQAVARTIEQEAARSCNIGSATHIDLSGIASTLMVLALGLAAAMERGKR